MHEIYSEDEAEFLLHWKEMLNMYELQDNSWLKGIFELKEKWAMAYGREYFSAGKESTQLTESFNARLKDYLKSDLDLVQFFHHFERAVDDLRDNEKVAKYDASQKLPQLKLNIPLLRHARDVYTEKIFDMFQEEFEKSLLVSIEHKKWADNIGDFEVSVYGFSRLYAISVNSVDGKISCSCKKFEFSGIPCSHIMKVLDEMKIKSMIPEQLITKRWTKNARAGEIIVECGNAVQEDPQLEINNRYRSLCSTYVKLAGKAAESKEAYQYLQENAKLVSLKLDEILSVRCQSEHQNSSIEGGNKHDQVSNLAMDVLKQAGTTQITKLKEKTVKTRRKMRLKSFLEKSVKNRRSIKYSNVEQELQPLCARDEQVLYPIEVEPINLSENQ